MLSCLANCNGEILPNSVCHTSLEVQQQCGTSFLSHNGRRSACSAANTLWNKHFPVWTEISDSALVSGDRERVQQHQVTWPSAKQTIVLLFPLEKGLFSKSTGDQTLNSIVVTRWKVYYCRGNSIKIIIHSNLEFKRALCMPNVSD